MIFLVACNQPKKSFPEPSKPNILWIIGENMDLDLGVYGLKKVHTPNPDGLAAKGLKFTNVYSTSPVCAPSRSALMVGYVSK